jgi:hypothetical protein
MKCSQSGNRRPAGRNPRGAGIGGNRRRHAKCASDVSDNRGRQPFTAAGFTNSFRERRYALRRSCLNYGHPTGSERPPRGAWRRRDARLMRSCRDASRGDSLSRYTEAADRKQLTRDTMGKAEKRTWQPGLMFAKFEEVITMLEGLSFLMADREGFEPSLRFPVNTLSKRAPSAARPPVRKVRGTIASHPVTASAPSYPDKFSMKIKKYPHPQLDEGSS